MYRTKCTGALTGAALNTFFIINDIRFFNLSADRTYRTVSRTFGTALASFRADDKLPHCGTVVGYAFLFNYMFLILFSEQLQRTDNRQSRTLAKTAQCSIRNRIRELLKQIQIL